jgi:cell division protein FtsQ
MIQRLLPIAMSIVLLGTTGTLVGFALHAEKEVTYLGLEVDVEEIKGMFFVDAAGVRDAILAHDSIQGSWVESVSLQQVDAWIHSIPAVDNVEVYPGLDRILHVRVSQKEPVARLHTGPNQPDSYIDTKGESLPLSPYFTARVPIIHAKSLEHASEAFSLIQSTRKAPLWSAFIDQVLVKEDGGLEIIARIGGARIALGDTSNLDSKLNNLLTFYREQIRRGNLNEYQLINLSFAGQVVAQRYY